MLKRSLLSGLCIIGLMISLGCGEGNKAIKPKTFAPAPSEPPSGVKSSGGGGQQGAPVQAPK